MARAGRQDARRDSVIPEKHWQSQWHPRVKFCHKIGLNYVSCSPFRVPIARLAAAQAALQK